MQKKVDVVLIFNKAVLLDGNNTIDSFAQIWVNKFGGETYAFAGKSYYGHIDDNQSQVQIDNRKKFGFLTGGSTGYPIPGDGGAFYRFYRWDGSGKIYVQN